MQSPMAASCRQLQAWGGGETLPSLPHPVPQLPASHGILHMLVGSSWQCLWQLCCCCTWLEMPIWPDASCQTSGRTWPAFAQGGHVASGQIGTFSHMQQWQSHRKHCQEPPASMQHSAAASCRQLQEWGQGGAHSHPCYTESCSCMQEVSAGSFMCWPVAPGSVGGSSTTVAHGWRRQSGLMPPAPARAGPSWLLPEVRRWHRPDRHL